MGSSCGTSSGSCGEQANAGQQQCGSAGSQCGCGSPNCSGDPIDCATGMWACSFFKAMKELQIELLKAKIQKAWGSKMDKAADVVVEAMGAEWQAMMAKTKARAEFKGRLQSLWQEGQK